MILDRSSLPDAVIAARNAALSQVRKRLWDLRTSPVIVIERKRRDTHAENGSFSFDTVLRMIFSRPVLGGGHLFYPGLQTYSVSWLEKDFDEWKGLPSKIFVIHRIVLIQVHLKLWINLNYLNKCLWKRHFLYKSVQWGSDTWSKNRKMSFWLEENLRLCLVDSSGGLWNRREVHRWPLSQSRAQCQKVSGISLKGHVLTFSSLS